MKRGPYRAVSLGSHEVFAVLLFVLLYCVLPN